MTIHRIGKNPKTAPSMPAMEAWPTGIEYATIATTRETASDTSAAYNAAIRTTPSRTNSVSRGIMARSAVSASDPDTASITRRYMGHLVFGRSVVTCHFAESLERVGGIVVGDAPRVSTESPRIEASITSM